MPFDINKHEIDIQNLKDQNVLDFEKDKIQAKQIEELKKELSMYNNKNSVLINSLQQQIKSLITKGVGDGSSIIEIINNLTSTSTTSALSANQGRILKQYIDNLESLINSLDPDGDNSVILEKLNNMPTDLSLTNNLLQLKKADGSTIGSGVIISTGTGSGSGDIYFSDVSKNEVFILSTNTTPTVVYGNIVLSKTSLNINEGSTDSFTVKLDKAPTNNQVVNLSVSNSNCTINKSSLTFTSSNYSTTQTVTVSGVKDSSSYVNKSSTITLSSSNVSNKTINVRIVNTDVQPSQPDQPTLTSISAVYTQGDTVIYPTTSLDIIKNNLVVTAHYSDGSSSVISDYDLSATLIVGTSRVNVSYEDATTTFDVTVSEEVTSGGDSNGLVLSYSYDSITKNPEAYNFTLVDKTGNGYNTLLQSNKSGYDYVAYDSYFKGVNGMTITGPNISSINNEFTIEYVVKTANTNGGILFALDDYQLMTSTSATTLKDSSQLYATITTNLTDNSNFKQFVCTVDIANKIGKLYCNGSLVASDTDGSGAKALTNKLFTPLQASPNFHIKTIKVYNKVLTDEEILNNYNNMEV